jgi:hypothetical protein
MNKIKLTFTADIVTFSKGQQFSDDNFQRIVDRMSGLLKEYAQYNEFLADNIKLELEWKK